MSRERKSGAYCIPSEQPPVPAGFVAAWQLQNVLLPVWWGERADLGPTTLFGLSAGWGTMLGTIEQQGQIRGAANKIIEDARNRRIRFFVWRERAVPQPLPFGVWHTADPDLLRDSVFSGVLRLGKDGPAWWAEGMTLCLPEDKAEEWLDAVQSTHVLPERDDAEARLKELWARRNAASKIEDWGQGAISRERDERELETLVAEEAYRQTHADSGSMRHRGAGRPNITGPAADAYLELFPNGHGDLTWDEVLDQISKRTGRKAPSRQALSAKLKKLGRR